MDAKVLCNRLKNQPWTGVYACGVRRSARGAPYYAVNTTLSPASMRSLIPPTVLARWHGETVRLPVRVEYRARSYNALGEEPLPSSMLVPALIGVGISIATMCAITFGVAYAVSKEEARV